MITKHLTEEQADKLSDEMLARRSMDILYALGTREPWLQPLEDLAVVLLSEGAEPVVMPRGMAIDFLERSLLQVAPGIRALAPRNHVHAVIVHADAGIVTTTTHRAIVDRSELS